MLHSYLRAVGFTNHESFDDIIKNVVNEPTTSTSFEINGNEFHEFHKKFTENTGIAVFGYFKGENDKNEFIIEHYYPYVLSEEESIIDASDLSIEQVSDKYAYLGMFDSLLMNMVLIFYINDNILLDRLGFFNKVEIDNCQLNISALSLEGKVILPIMKDIKEVNEKKQYNDRKTHLLERAKNGDEDAIETLTMDDMALQQMLYTRTKSEDVLSIVETYFMPDGLENDKYAIMGDIVSVKEQKNIVTKETLYLLTIQSNDINLTIAINKRDLVGEPLVGRRFRGKLWLQGTIKNIDN